MSGVLLTAPLHGPPRAPIYFMAAGVGASSFFTDSGSAFLLANNSLTCQIAVSGTNPLNAGMPVSRIPFSTFQYVSQTEPSPLPFPKE